MLKSLACRQRRPAHAALSPAAKIDAWCAALSKR
jgi:hypothetical protein